MRLSRGQFKNDKDLIHAPNTYCRPEEDLRNHSLPQAGGEDPKQAADAKEGGDSRDNKNGRGDSFLFVPLSEQGVNGCHGHGGVQCCGLDCVCIWNGK